MAAYVSQKDAILAKARAEGIPLEVYHERYMTSYQWASNTYPGASYAVRQFFTELWTWEHFWRKGETFLGVNPMYGELQDALHRIRDLEATMKIKDDTIAKKGITMQQKENEIRNKAGLIQRKDELIEQKNKEISTLLQRNRALLDESQKKKAEGFAHKEQTAGAENKPLNQATKFYPVIKQVPTATSFGQSLQSRSAVTIEPKNPVAAISNVAGFPEYSPFRRPSSFSQHIWDKKAPDDASGPATHTHFQFPTSTVFNPAAKSQMAESMRECDDSKGTKRKPEDEGTTADGEKRVKQEHQ